MSHQSNIEPTPDLADIAMKPAPTSPDTRDISGVDPTDPPAKDVTLPTE